MTPRRKPVGHITKSRVFLFFPLENESVLKTIFHKRPVEIFLEHSTDCFSKTFHDEGFSWSMMCTYFHNVTLPFCE
jgi:hypothetical protein